MAGGRLAQVQSVATIPVIPVFPHAEAAVQHDVQHYMRPGTLQLAALPPLSLYIHLPWCLKKCPYCDLSLIHI
jgi:coproporphyrinogen III oxidase-like Fe-S oxidoreductase